ncbi:MAG: ATP cone domain-containing protein, partial [bacterium]|nr:ATP cone domain-containing protein [bacterium]
MARVALTHVCKRDGRLVPFERQHLVRSIQAAAESAGVASAVFAQELADAVILHLEQSFPTTAPSTAAIAEAIETVLLGVNLRTAAEAYRAYRAARDHSRMHCTVVKPLQPSLFAADLALHVAFDGSQRTAAWDRTRIVHALEREARLARRVAEDIARAVEERLLSSDLRRVTTTLIRALVDNELLARGFTASLRQRSAVAVPFADVDRAMQDGAPLAQTIGRQVTRTYALARIYSEDVADAHERGMLALDCLDHPAGVYSLLQPFPGVNAQTHLRETLQQLQNGLLTCSACAVTDLATALPLLHEVLTWLPPLSPGQRVTYEIDADAAGMLAQGLRDLPPHPDVVFQLQGLPAERPALVAAMLALHQRGWGIAWAAQPALHTWHSRCTINLPQAVYRARQRDLDGVIEEVYRALELAVQACHQRALYLRTQPGSLAGAAQYAALDIAGLDSAIAILTGAGIFDRGESRACLRVLLGALHTSVQHATQHDGVQNRLVAGEP